MKNILLNAVITVFGISIGVGPIGSFVLWKKLSYFGDTIAHSALLGVTLAMIMHVHHIIGILLIATLPSLMLLQLRNYYTKDMLFNITSNSSLALASIILSIIPLSNTNVITSMLFGDVLAIDYSDIIVLYIATISIATIIACQWKKWLLITISTDLAIVAKLNTKILEIEFMILLSILIAVSINIIGILLITSLLIIPAATARVIIKTPIQMIVLSSILCFTSSICGLFASYTFDIPAGPSIIMMSTAILIATNLCSYIHSHRLSLRLLNR